MLASTQHYLVSKSINISFFIAVTMTIHVSFCQLLKHREPVQLNWKRTVFPARARLIQLASIYPRLCST